MIATAASGAAFDEVDFRKLLDAVGAGQPWHIERLRGGANNRVFLAQSSAGRFVIKQYHLDARDQRDRLASEFTFLRYAWDNGIRIVPQPIARDDTHGLGLYGFVDGKPLAPGTVGKAEVEAALDFVAALNRHRAQGAALSAAAESCFCLDDHLTLVERRVERLRTLDASAPYADDARALVESQLLPAFQRLYPQVVTRAATLGIDRREPLAPAVRCISPSDFGFHNALRRGDGSLVFCDFEYAGWDDPAKLACDFFCQPAVPVSAAFFADFADGLAGLIGEPRGAERYALLLDLYRIKWICIIMNEFLPVGAARRRFADDSDRQQRCAAQLTKARTALAAISS